MKVSIIVPVYNVEDYIEECMESILNQTFNDYEVIIVNDGSTDRSINLLMKYINNNVLLYNKENGGLSSARNYGLRKARGEYICFVDSDDILEKDFLLNLYIAANQNNCDIVLGKHSILLNNKKVKNNIHSKSSKTITTGKDFLKLQLFDDELRCEVWDDIYKRSFLLENKLKFYEGLIHEDDEFTFRALLKAERVLSIDSFGYIYRHRENSIMSSSKIKKRVNDLSIIIRDLQQMYLNEQSEEVRVLIYLRSINMIGALTNLISIQKEKKELISIVNKNINLKFWKQENIVFYIKGILIWINYKIYVYLISLKNIIKNFRKY